jgi:hypothetical protein
MNNLTEKKKWTIMLYLAGDNNLDLNGVMDLDEAKKVGSNGHFNVVAEFDREGPGLPTHRYYLRKGTSLQADVVESLGEINTGDPEVLFSFIKWAVDHYPAEHYMLILWNHGQGWDDTNIFARKAGSRRIPRTDRLRHAFFKTSVEHVASLSLTDSKMARAILIDENAKDFLDCLELKQVMLEAKNYIGKRIDVFGMDACLMSMVEIACQVQESVEYMVGSEETEPLDGWPYDTILESLDGNSRMAPDELGRTVVEQYIGYYTAQDEDVTLSACNLGAIQTFMEAMTHLTRMLTDGMSDYRIREMIAEARNRSQEYQMNDNIDLVSFCKLLKVQNVSKEISDACGSVISAITDHHGLVVSTGYHGASMKQSNGLAIYFPVSVVSPLYNRLDFAQKTGWGDFLQTYTHLNG